MRWKILIITLFIGVMIIIGTAEATPDIGKVNLTEKIDKKFDVEVVAPGTTIVEVNEHDPTSYDPYQFTSIEGSVVVGEDYKLLKIKATDSSSQVSEKDIGAGGCTNYYYNKIAPYDYADVYLVPSESKMTLYLNTIKKENASIIGICVYPVAKNTWQ